MTVERIGTTFAMKNLFLVIALSLLAAVSCLADSGINPGSADHKEKIALLPFYNFTDNVQASRQIMTAVKGALEAKGFEVVDGEAIEEFFCKKNVKLLPHIYISKDLADALSKELPVTKIFTGSIVSFIPEGTVHAGLLARMIDARTGAIVWADHAFVSGDDFISVLGLGEITTMAQLLPKVTGKLLSSLKTDLPDRGGLKYRVAVTPFANKSGFPGAGTLITHLFIEEIFKQHLMEPVEFGDVRKALADVKAKKRGELEHSKMEELSNTLHTERIIVGTVEQYLGGEVPLSPRGISISARLLDTGRKKILWYNSEQTTGEKTIIAFDKGGQEPADKISYRAVEALIKNMKASLSK